MTVNLTTLDNGIRVVTDEIDHVKSISCGAWFSAGTRHETETENGIAHLLEHMAFKGTSKRSAYDISVEIESVGGYLNAYTSRETTAYYARALSQHLPLCIDILSDILQNSTFEENELEHEKGVVLQELGQAKDTPDDIIFDYFQEECYPQQPMGYSILGTEESVKSIQSEDLKNFIHQKYTPENMVFSASGQIKHDEIVKLVEQSFKNLNPSKQQDFQQANYVGKTKFDIKPLEQAHVLIGTEAINYYDPLYFPLMIYSMILGGGMSSRLFQEIREKRGMVYSIFTTTAIFKDSGTFGIYAGTGVEELKQLTPLIAQELEKACKGFLDDEIQKAKSQLKASLLMGLESTSNRSERYANQVLIHGTPKSIDEITQKIDEIHNQQLIEIANKIYQNKPTLVGVGPVDYLKNHYAELNSFSQIK